MTFGTLPDGRTVDRITISNGDLSVSILTYGAIVQDVRLKGHDYNLTLGSDDINDYLTSMKHYGPIIAPVGNRIKGARATFGGIEHMLTPNEGRNILHSAEGGSQFKLWTVEDQTPDTVTLNDGPASRPVTGSIAVGRSSHLSNSGGATAAAASVPGVTAPVTQSTFHPSG